MYQPIRYNNRARKSAIKHGVCPLCDLVRDLVLDHCRRHGWVRGSICYSCNAKMDYLDTGYHTARYYPAKYYDWRYHCIDCKKKAVRT